ncbi:hypothetical protein CDD80_4513 [Ophiocordyceps camponoti-rufipedis]|uniref:Uncharacterized protein n=1 Tax=Ophiocordyceps camponoti-rufipedis TaxID=2004952 RepID=A0A2C5YZX5_9HYPO|nr:hypothetical protein CDD80_4513 [Ophiocordyceps camponoti-rufipedis]
MDSSKKQEKKQGEKQFSIQPIEGTGGDSAKMSSHNAQPGPVMVDKMPGQEGTAEERRARMEALNKQ